MNDRSVYGNDANSVWPAGKLIDKRFKILEFLGSGATGHVYKCCNVITDELVAIKVLNEFLNSDEKAVERFLREAKLSSQLTHQSIASVKAFGKSDEASLYLVQEYLEGQSLAALLKTTALTPAIIKTLTISLADALAFAHSQNILHRDLKPENIMVLQADEENVSCKILDFGLATLIETADTEQKLTTTGVLTGTPAYMSPERCRGEKASIASEIYSLGCIFYELLFRTPPFTAESSLQVMSMHLNAPISFPDNHQISDRLKSILTRCLDKDPSQRFPDCQTLSDELKSTDFQFRRGQPRILASAAILLTIAFVCIFNQAIQKKPVTDKITNPSVQNKQKKIAYDSKILPLSQLFTRFDRQDLDTETRRAIAAEIVSQGRKRLPAPKEALEDKAKVMAQRIMQAYTSLCVSAPTENDRKQTKIEATAFAKDYLNKKDVNLSNFYYDLCAYYPEKETMNLLWQAYISCETPEQEFQKALDSAQLIMTRFHDPNEAEKYFLRAYNLAPKIAIDDGMKFQLAELRYELDLLKGKRDIAKEKTDLKNFLLRRTEFDKNELDRIRKCGFMCEGIHEQFPDEALEWNDQCLKLLDEIEKEEKIDRVKNERQITLRVRELINQNRKQSKGEPTRLKIRANNQG